MGSHPTLAAWPKIARIFALSLFLAACATPPEPVSERGAWAGRAIGPPPGRKPHLRQAIISHANREWEYFGRQTVVMKGSKESIPNVGAWEDDDSRYSGRVNNYWRAVGKSQIYGVDCRQPWSAAFMSWLMASSGVPESQFPRVPAHWIYLASMIDDASYPGRYFVPRRVSDYSPEPGDLICAYRGHGRLPSSGGYVSSRALSDKPTHCDLVVEKNGRELQAIGGNVRNSVSKVTLQLDGSGHLQALPRRPWFLVLENRL